MAFMNPGHLSVRPDMKMPDQEMRSLAGGVFGFGSGIRAAVS